MNMFKLFRGSTIKDKKVEPLVSFSIRKRLVFQVTLIITLFSLLLWSLSTLESYQARKLHDKKISVNGEKSTEKLKKIGKELGYSLGVKTSKDDLISSLKLDEDLMGSLADGSFLHLNITREKEWRKPLTYKEKDGLKVPDSLFRIKVSTYFDPDHMKSTGVLEDTTIEIETRKLEIWKRAMWGYGFDPIVLSRKDAKEQPLYAEFVKANDDIYILKYEAIFAWVARGAGLFMDYHILPVERSMDEIQAVGAPQTDSSKIDFEPLKDRSPLIMANFFDTTFEYLTLYQPYGYNLMHANKREGVRLLEQLTEGDSDDVIRSTFEFHHGERAFAQYSKDTVTKMLNGQEVSEEQVADIMEIHMHQVFQRRYARGGIVIVHPMEDETEVVTYPMKSLAKRLSMCDSSDLALTCPPTPRNLNAAVSVKRLKRNIFDEAYQICGNPCAHDSPFKHIYEENSRKNVTYALKISESDRLPKGDADAFALVGVPHPVTALTLLEKRGDVTPGDARSYLQRDTFIRQLTSAFIHGNTVGIKFRLLLCKDAIFSTMMWSNSWWGIWEKLTVASLHTIEDMLSYDFGFQIPGRTTGIVELEVAKAPEDSSDAGMLDISRRRALSIHEQPDPSVDTKQVNSIESWNLADTELWVFLDEWMARKSKITHDRFFQS